PCHPRVQRIRSGSAYPHTAAINAKLHDLPLPLPPCATRHLRLPLGGVNSFANGLGSLMDAVVIVIAVNCNDGYCGGLHGAIARLMVYFLAVAISMLS